MNLKLKKTDYQIETTLGVIDIHQIEDSTVFSVEFFPPNQSKKSFEDAEFINLHNFARADGLNPDYIHFDNHPNWSRSKYYDMKHSAILGIFSLLATIENLEDFKGESYYEELRVIRNKWNDDYCTLCGEYIGDVDVREDITGLTYCEDCFLDIKSNELQDRISQVCEQG